MVERPILFKGRLVRAILEGRKTQTRRPLKPQPIPECASMIDCGFDVKTGKEIFGGRDKAGQALYPFPVADHSFVPEILCPYGKPGDVLWVRETWWHYKSAEIEQSAWSGTMCVNVEGRGSFNENTPADFDPSLHGIWKRRPSIHMPKWACRLRLKVTGVRVERVYDISEADALAEGVGGVAKEDTYVSARAEFAAGWNSIYAKGDFAWAKSPWVWVVSFEREDSTAGASGGK